MCDAHLDNDPAGLACTRCDTHSKGHIYIASAGCDLGKGAES